MALLRRSHRVAVVVTVTARNPQGATAVTSYHVTLRLPSGHHTSHHRKRGSVQIG
jgi:hypothetical protein